MDILEIKIKGKKFKILSKKVLRSAGEVLLKFKYGIRRRVVCQSIICLNAKLEKLFHKFAPLFNLLGDTLKIAI
jgi:hypothetical protein